MLLPNAHISWSQLDLVERSPKAWVDYYLRGLPRYENDAMRFGSLFAKVRETGEGGDEVMRTVASLAPRYPEMEKVLEVDWETPSGVVTLHARLDSYDPDTHSFLDDKTGAKPWTQAKVDSHGQITFYDMLLYLKNGALAPRKGVIWYETAWEGGIGSLTGNFEVIETKRTMRDILEMLSRVDKATEKILLLQDNFLKI